MRLLWLTLAILINLTPRLEAASSWIIVSVADQQLLLVERGVPTKRYKISTSRFGLGDAPNSYRTPVGVLEVAQKIGASAPAGAVFKGRQRTGEVVAANSPGRDPIVTRILWLRGLQKSNQNAYGRGIYIHGTPAERQLGRPVSYGCIRMRSRDVMDLFNRVPVGTRLKVTRSSLGSTLGRRTADLSRELFPG